MKTFIIILGFCILGVCAYADVADPVLAFKEMAHLPSGTVIYRWDADVNDDGRKEVFLNLATGYNHQAKRGNPKIVPGWIVYLQNPGKTGYQLSRGVEDSEVGPGVGPGVPEIDETRMFIGPITQLGKRGIVTVQIDYPKRGPAVAYIRAYTIEADHFKCVLLAQFDPTLEKNAIFDQYLSKSKRTMVTLKKITL